MFCAELMSLETGAWFTLGIDGATDERRDLRGKVGPAPAAI
jgi:hypothetical protein